MPYLSVRLDNFSAHDIQVYSEENNAWLGVYLENGRVSFWLVTNYKP